LYAINSGSHTDIDGTIKSYSGYTYNFFNESGSNTELSNINYTSGEGNIMVRLEAESKAGYEFISNSIITYPFGADGSISSSPYNTF